MIFQRRNMNARTVVLWTLLLARKTSAFNVQSEEEEMSFIQSSAIKFFGVKNSTEDILHLPSGFKSSYFGYSFSFYDKGGGDIGLLTGAPKTIDPKNPGFQQQGLGVNTDPKGNIETCPITASLFTGASPNCIQVNPPNPVAGDNFGVSVVGGGNGNTLACSTTRAQDCETVRYSPGTCFSSSNYGATWNPTQDTLTSKCPTTNVEVLFVLDGSGSIGTNFGTVLDWVKTISQRIGIDEGVVTVGVVQYSHYSGDYTLDKQPWIVTEIKIGEYKKYDQFASKVDSIMLHGFTTYTGRALEKVMTDFKNTEHYGEPTNKQVMILLTDGIATDAALVPGNAEKLRNIGVIPYAVGVGNEGAVNITELRLIANGDANNDTRVFMASSFSGLNAIAEELEAEIGGLALEGGGGGQNGTGFDLQFGQMGSSIAYGKTARRRKRRDTSRIPVVPNLF